MSNSRLSSNHIFSIFHSLPGFYLIVKPDFPHFTIQDATDSFLKEARLKREDVLGADLSAAFFLNADCADSTGFRDLTVELSQAIRLKKAAQVPYYYKFNLGAGINPGVEKLWGISLTPQVNKSGEVDFVILNLRDATSKLLTEKSEKQALRALSENTQYYNALFEANPDAVFSLNKEGKFTSANTALVALAGRPLSDLNEMTFTQLIVPENLESTLAHFQLAMQGKPQQYEAGIQTSKGNRLFLSLCNLPIVVDKKITGIYVIAKDITPEKLAGEALTAEKENYKTILENSMDGWVLGSLDGHIYEVNAATTAMFGYGQQELMLLGWQAIIDTGDNSVAAKIKSMLNDKKIKTEITGIRKNGERFPVEISSVIFLDVNGEEQVSTYISDVSFRRKSEATVMRSEKLLRQAEAIAHLGSWEYDLMNSKLTWSDEFFRICGLEPQCFEPTFEKLLGLAHVGDRDNVRVQFRNAVSRGSDHGLQSRIIRPDGSIRVVHTQGKLIRNAAGLPEKLIGVMRDVTEIVAASNILKESEAKYRAVFHKSPLPKWIYDQDSLRFLEVNKAALAHYGFTETEFLSMTLKDIRPEEDSGLLLNELNRLERPVNKLDGPYRHKKKNGDLIYVELTGLLVDHSERKAVMITCNDITEKLNFEEALVKSHDRYNYALKASFDAIWDWDFAKQTVYRGEAYKTLFGHELEDSFSSSGKWHQSVHPDDKDRVLASIEDALKGDNPIWTAKYWLRKADRSYAYVNDRGTIIKDENGTPYRMVGAMQDITRQKTEEQEREKLIEELIRNNKDLQQFSFIISHNLKAPIANLLGILNILDTHAIKDAETLLLIDGLSKSTRQLNDTVNDLNNILVVKRNSNYNFQQLHLEDIWKRTIELVHGLCAAAGAEIISDFSASPQVYFSKAYLESIFLNLLSNSLRYRSPNRKPRIELSSFEDSGSVVLSFKDNGLGIDLARHGKKIFKLYQQFHNHPDGRGLGLYMIASQLQASGGKIEVESKANKGACFKVTFPKATLNQIESDT